MLSNVVVRRTREIGVRVALGATPGDVVRMVIRQGLMPVASGAVAGLAVGAIVRMSLQPNFQRLIAPLDYAALAVVPLAFLAAALVACYLPARRAARIDPNVALRSA